ncbi:MAG: hypothetical protein H7Z19_20310 [Chitinophagaceae bacterium]|nr:hypothetical protein [Rubrivivax sp.]
MDLPFTSDQFYRVFRGYNEAIWPAQWLLVALALVAVGLVLRPSRWSGVGVSTILAFLWMWIAIAYHLVFFAGINPAAYGFAAVSAVGAAVFVWQGVFRRRLHFRWSSGPRSYTGAALVAFALVVYPAWLFYSGHAYPAMATFGLPCPTTLFTIGLLAFAAPPYLRSPLVVPVLWCLVGAQAAV